MLHYLQHQPGEGRYNLLGRFMPSRMFVITRSPSQPFLQWLQACSLRVCLYLLTCYAPHTCLKQPGVHHVPHDGVQVADFNLSRSVMKGTGISNAEINSYFCAAPEKLAGQVRAHAAHLSGDQAQGMQMPSDARTTVAPDCAPL